MGGYPHPADRRRIRELELGYAAMAADREHEQEAMEWIEAMIGDVAEEPSD